MSPSVRVMRKSLGSRSISNPIAARQITSGSSGGAAAVAANPRYPESTGKAAI
jgi:Asp-tRNA(Asn)/Glu-tRNA(Gln) amidotransferase A subunit family amidase